MNAFSSFCVPEVEGCGPVRGAAEQVENLPILAQVAFLDLSKNASNPPCLQHIVSGRVTTDVCCVDAESTLNLIDVNDLRCIRTVQNAHASPVTSCCFFNNNSHVFITCSQDGSIKIWDFRQKSLSIPGKAEAEATLQVAPAGSQEADMWALAVRQDDNVFATSFKNWVKGYDVRAVCSNLGCAETAQGTNYSGNRKRAKKLLWDIQVHGDLVTAVRFHPLYPHLLISGGEDSLVCITDTSALKSLSNGAEEIAPVSCFSQECAVKDLVLLGPEASCVCIRSAMEDVSLWQVEGLAEYCSGAGADGVNVRRRAEWLSVRSHPSLREGDSSGYVVDVFYDQLVGRLFILAGR